MIAAAPHLQVPRLPVPEPLPGPLGPIRLMLALRANPVATWTKAHFEQPVLQGRSVLGDLTIVSDPAGIRHVLVDNAANYRKDALQLRVLGTGLGHGLLTADGEDWRAQRRALAPLFTPRRVAEFLPSMAASADWLVARWSGLREGRRLDVSTEMSRVALDVLERTIFPAGLGRDPGEFAKALSAFFESTGQLHPFDLLGLPSYVPRVGRKDPGPALRFFDEAVTAIVTERRAQIETAPETTNNQRPDLLTLLLKAADPETGQGLTEAEVRANIVTFIGAGHETTANGLTWSLFLLSQHPAWRARAEAEADAALTDGAPIGAETLARLPLVRAVFDEALRLYPPAATLSREAIGPDEVCGRRVRAGSTVVISPWVLHRHKRLWENPESFDPGRFLPGRRESIDRFAYLPFGAGPRVCIGQGFALQEAVILLATILHRFRLELAPGHVPMPMQRVTLRPRGGMPMLLHRR